MKEKGKRVRFSLLETDYFKLMDILTFRKEQDNGVIKNKTDKIVAKLLKQRSKNFDCEK